MAYLCMRNPRLCGGQPLVDAVKSDYLLHLIRKMLQSRSEGLYIRSLRVRIKLLFAHLFPRQVRPAISRLLFPRLKDLACATGKSPLTSTSVPRSPPRLSTFTTHSLYLRTFLSLVGMILTFELLVYVGFVHCCCPRVISSEFQS